MNVLDLFSGIGGFSLGLERAGMRTVAFSEIDPYCRRVLAKHWPDVPIYGDIRELTADRLMADSASWRNERQSKLSGEPFQSVSGNQTGVDVICGGFPCQDISVAGKGAGIGGERSGLWSEYARIIGEVRPRYVIVENVAALLSRGLGVVLGDLAALGFDAEWHCIPASAVGAPHRRDRVWIVAYPAGEGWRSEGAAIPGEANGGRAFSIAGRTSDVADAAGERQPQPIRPAASLRERKTLEFAGLFGEQGRTWIAEPDVGRVAHGVPARVDRLRALGNAVVPQIPEIIGRAIMSAALEPKPWDVAPDVAPAPGAKSET